MDGNVQTLTIAIGWVVLAAFAATFIVAILGLCGKILIPPRYQAILFTKMILEVIAAVFFILYHGINRVKAYDISGKWRYSCTATYPTNVAVGGYCTISSRIESGETIWTLDGERLWKRSGSNVQSFAVTKGIPWNSTWANVQGKDELRFHYVLHPEDKNIAGLGEAKIQALGNTPYAISGYFYQLPPQEPLHGVMKFEKITNESEAYPQ